MRTQVKKAKSKRPAVRSLKIQLQVRNNSLEEKIVPEIRLCGNWLEELGFIPEKGVNITTRKKLLIIRVEE
jgi:hypothetical protein